jgi:predicted nuclease of predicted toxin-antitoxin system
MSVLVDHNVPCKYVRWLQDWGYNASPLADHVPPDSTDPDVIALAQALDAVLLTADLDFANIFDYPPGNYAGIVVMRYEAANETALAHTLQQVMNDLYRDGLRGVLVIVTPSHYRVRRP